MSAEPYYTLQEAAGLLKVHPQTLRRWIRQGRLSAKRFGKQIRLSAGQLDAVGRPARDDAGSDLDRFSRLALESLADVWDNDEDAIYDDWRSLYGVGKG